ncbi:MAG: hypothetical protein V2A54_07900 [Bacteroidota bacterium]
MKLSNIKILAPVIFAVSIFLLSHLVEKKFNTTSFGNPIGEKKDTIYLDSTRCQYKVVTTYDSSRYEEYYIYDYNFRYISYNFLGIKTIEGYLDKNGLDKDLQITYYPDGSVRDILYMFNKFGTEEVTIQLPFNNNKDTIITVACQDGYYIKFYNNGKIKEEYTLIDCAKSGLCLEHYENGNIKTRGVFNKGFPIGIFNYYDQTGLLVKQDSMFYKPDCRAFNKRSKTNPDH